MSPVLTQKMVSARATLLRSGLLLSMIEDLVQRGPEHVYRELTRRGYVWSVDRAVWRKSRKPRKTPIVIVKGGYLDHCEIRLIVRANEVDLAITEFSAAMQNMGYEVTRVSVHTSRNPGELLVYCHVHQNGGRNG